VGTRQIQTGLDSKNYSRALQQGTAHYFSVTCGASSGTGSFTTKTLPFGVTMEDLIPLNADGTYLNPTVSTTNRAETLIDPSTGVLVRHVSLPGDNPQSQGASGPGASAGGFGNWCNNVVTASGNWLCSMFDIPQGIYPNLYAINPTSGVVLYLGHAYFAPANIDPNGDSLHGIVNGEAILWDNSSANVAYSAYNIRLRS